MAEPSLIRSTVFRRTLAVVLALSLVAAGVIALVGWHANESLTRATTRAIDADIGALRSTYAKSGVAGLVAAVGERSRPRGSDLYLLEDEQGRRLAGNLVEIPLLPEGRRAGTFSYRPPGVPGQATRTAAGVVIDLDRNGTLLVARDIEDQRELLFAIYRSVGLGAGVLALLGIAGGLALSRHILGRIDTMSAATSRIMTGDLTGRIPLDGSADELDRLATRLNQMLERIEQLMAGLREVSDNIAHDLRTPLNRLRNRAEAALGDTNGSPAWRQGLEHVIDEADNLIKTFNALLLIARLEAGNAAEQDEQLDLAALMKDIGELYEPVAEDAGFTLSLDVEGPAPVVTNRQLIGQALTNLIDNALKYGSPPTPRANGQERMGAITLALSTSGNWARVTVADGGSGIPEADRERALKRFVRLEQSRSKPGTGLGLSLVAAVARIYGGHITLADNAPGLKVILDLPLANGRQDVATSTGAKVALPATSEGGSTHEARLVPPR